MGDPKCKCIFHEDTNIVDTMLCEVHPVPNYLAPSPARDDAETVKLTDDEWRSIYDASSVHSGDMKFWSHHLRAAIESILAAHMAAPDELTALLADLEVQQKQNKELADELTALREKADWDEWACKKNQELFRQASDERDALRKGIREALNDPHHIQQRLIDLLGDA